MRGLWPKLALLVMSLLLGLAAVEVAVRVSGAARPAELSELFDRPTLAYVPVPTRHHPWVAEGAQTLRVAVIGDSFTVGSGNQVYDAYPARLERLLNLNTEVRPAVVKVRAKSGTATEQQRGFLLEALKERPHLVILGIVLNDTETRDDPSLGARREMTLPQVPTGWTLAAVRRSHALRLAYHKVERARAGWALLEYYRHNFDPGYVGWARFREALEFFADNCRRRKIHFVAVVFPGIFNLDESEYPFRYAHDRMRQALEEESIAHLDLLDTFLGKSEIRLAAQPTLDGHPNEIAHRVAAEAIFEYLLDEGLIESGYRPQLQKPVAPRQSLRAARRMLTPTALAE